MSVDIYEYAEGKKLSLRQVLDFTTGVNPLGPSNQAKHAVRKGARDMGLFPDRRVGYLTRYLCKLEDIAEDRIVFGTGSTHLLHLLLRIARPRKVAVLSPVSALREETLVGHDVEIRRVWVEGGRPFVVDVGKLLDAMGETDMLIVSYPHEVTGAVISPDDLTLLIREADRLGKVLVIDEAYRDYTVLNSPIRETAASAGAVVLRTFSLYHALGGLRLGYAAGSTRLIKEMQAARPTGEINGLAPHAAMRSLKDTGFKTRTLRFIEDEKSYVRGKLSTIKGVEAIDTPCNFLLLALHAEEEYLHAKFMERNILIDTFEGAPGGTYIRLPMGRHKDNAIFMRTLARIAKELA